jgi:hypothetical protein
MPLKNEKVMTHEVALLSNIGPHQHNDLMSHNFFILSWQATEE